MTKLLTSLRKIEMLPHRTPGCRDIHFDYDNKVVYKMDDGMAQSSHEWDFWKTYRTKVDLLVPILGHARPRSSVFWIAQPLVCTDPKVVRERWKSLLGKDFETLLDEVEHRFYDEAKRAAKTRAARRLVKDLEFLVDDAGLRDFSFEPDRRQWGVRNNKMFLLDYGLTN